MRKCVRTGLQALLLVSALLFSIESHANDARFPIFLPNCPTPLLLSAPAEFEGAANEQNMLDHLAANEARKGTYVLALSAPSRPELWLLVLELGTTKDVQGSVTQTHFNSLRDYMARQKPEALAEGMKYAEALSKGGEIPTTIKGANLYSVSDDPQTITLLALTRSEVLGQDIASFNATKLIFVHRCIVQVSIFSPISSMSIQEFEALVPYLAVQ